MVMKDERAYLFFALAFDLAAGFLDLTEVFLGLALAAGFFLTTVFFLADAGLRLGAAAVFLVAFLAAVACLRLAGALAGSFFMAGAGAVFGSTFPIIGEGVEEKEEDGAAGIEAVALTAAPAAGSLMAVSQPGVNISRRSRETGLARPQRGQWAS
jgi:hypothetical protein